MKVYFGGGLGIRSGNLAGLLKAATPLLQGKGHTVLTCGPIETEAALYERHLTMVAECDVLVAPIDYPTLELGADIQEAVRIEKGVLCLTNGKVPVTSALVIGADATGYLSLAKYEVLGDFVKKIDCFAKQIQKKLLAA